MKMKKQRTKNEIINQTKNNKQQKEKIMMETFNAYMNMSLYILNKEFGIGPARAEKYIDDFQNLLSDISEDNIDFDKIKEYNESKLGIQIGGESKL